MTRGYDFTVAGVLIIIAVVIHRMGVELFSPGGVLWGVATDGTSVVNGTQHAWLWYQIIVQWVPLAVAVSALIWAFVREYRRLVQTSQQPVR